MIMDASSLLDFALNEEPRGLGVQATRQLLGHDPIDMLLSLRQLSVHVGQEHSAYVERMMQQGRPWDQLTEMFNFTERFPRRLRLSQYLQLDTTEWTGGSQFSADDYLGQGMSAQLDDVRCFAGKRGQVSALHFDWNPHPIIIWGLSGQKKFTVLPPGTHSAQGGYSIFAPTFALPIQSELEFIVREGEALVIPPFWWHQASYLTDACSLSLRPRTPISGVHFTTELYPSWKVLALHAQLGIESARQYLGEVAQSAQKLVALEERYRFIEDKLHSVTPSNAAEHKNYRRWSLGYLHYQTTIRSLPLTDSAQL